MENAENTSGMGAGHPVPEAVKGLSWGGFLLNWIWAIGNKTWIGLICIVFSPFAFVLLFKGREWAWQAKKWASVEEFNRVQRLWALWGVGLLVLFAVAFIGFMVIVGTAIKDNAVVIPNTPSSESAPAADPAPPAPPADKDK